MNVNYTISIEDIQNIDGIEYTIDQLAQGLAQVRSQYNQRTGQSLTDSEWLQWAFLQNLVSWYKQNKGAEPTEPTPIIPVADWNGLVNCVLAGELNSLYVRVTIASFVNPNTANLAEIANANNIAVAAGKIDQAIQVTKNEGAVNASIQLLLQTSNYVFTEEEKSTWNRKVDELNFSSLMNLN